MSKSVGNSLPADLIQLLDGHDLAAGEGLTILLLTTSEDGWPQVAMLSVGEVLAISPLRLRLALWPGSGSTANLRRNGQATLMLVTAAGAFYMRVRSRRLADLALSRGPRAAFEVEVEEVLVDLVAYAAISSGIQFELTDRENVLTSWEEAVTALRDIGP